MNSLSLFVSKPVPNALRSRRSHKSRFSSTVGLVWTWEYKSSR